MACPLLPLAKDSGKYFIVCKFSWFCLYLEGSSDIVEIYKNSEGTFDIVADGPHSDVPPQGNTSQDALVGDYWYHSKKKEPEVCTLLESMKRWKI